MQVLGAPQPNRVCEHDPVSAFGGQGYIRDETHAPSNAFAYLGMELLCWMVAFSSRSF